MTRLLIWSAILGCATFFASESTPEEIRTLGAEIGRLSGKYKLKERVAVTFISPRVCGVACETAERRIVIVDHGLEQNLRTLRHEWNHLWRLDQGCPDWKEEGPSIKAETEWAVHEERR